MRFRLRDVLMLMILVAAHLTALKYSMEIARAKMLGNHGALRFYASALAVSFGILFFIRIPEAKRISPPTIAFMRDLPWRRVSVYSCLTFALCGLSHSPRIDRDGFAFWLWLVLGVTSYEILIWFFPVKVGREGVIYKLEVIPWSKILVDRDEHGQIVRLACDGKEYRVDVPIEHQTQITELYAQSQGKPRP